MTEQPWTQHPSTYQPEPTVHLAGRVDTYPAAPWWKKPATAIAGGAAVIALAVGIVLGQATAAPSAPEECAVALDYAEEALGYSAEGMGVLGDALGGGYTALGRVSPKLDNITEDLERITPLYQEARTECLK